MTRMLRIESTPTLVGTGELNLTYTQESNTPHYIHVIGVALEGHAEGTVQRAIKITTVGPVREGTRTVQRAANEIKRLSEIDAVFAVVTRDAEGLGTWEELHRKLQRRGGDDAGGEGDALGKTYDFAMRAITPETLQNAMEAGRTIGNNMMSGRFEGRDERITMLRDTLSAHHLPVDTLSEPQISLLDAGVVEGMRRFTATGLDKRSSDVACGFCVFGFWVIAIFVGLAIGLLTIGLGLAVLGSGQVSSRIIRAIQSFGRAVGVALSDQRAAQVVLEAHLSPGASVTATIDALIYQLCKQTGACS